MRGWKREKHTDNYIVRHRCIDLCKLDIVGVAETHLLRDEQLKIEGYEWFGNNKTCIEECHVDQGELIF